MSPRLGCTCLTSNCSNWLERPDTSTKSGASEKSIDCWRPTRRSPFPIHALFGSSNRKHGAQIYPETCLPRSTRDQKVSFVPEDPLYSCSGFHSLRRDLSRPYLFVRKITRLQPIDVRVRRLNEPDKGDVILRKVEYVASQVHITKRGSSAGK